MDQIKRKVTIKRKVSLRQKVVNTPHVNPNPPTPQATGGWKKPVGALALVAILGTVGYFAFRKKTDYPIVPDPPIENVCDTTDKGDVESQTPTSNSDKTERKKDGEDVTTNPGETKGDNEPENSSPNPSDVSGGTKDKPSDTPTEIASSKPDKSPIETTSNPSPKPKSTPEGSLQDKALQAIRGDLGNGLERLEALGDEYDAVQEQVNTLVKNMKF